MSGAASPDEAPAPAPKRPFFRKASVSTPLSRSALERQGRVCTAAFSAMGRDAAVAYLNTPDQLTTQRPLDLAAAGVEGEAAVMVAIGAYRAVPQPA